MKILRLRFAIFCLAVLLIISVPICKPVLLNYSPATSVEYSFYTGVLSENINNASIIKNGNSAIVKCDGVYATSVRKQLDNIYGESMKIKSADATYLQNLLNSFNGKILRQEKLDNIQIFYCYDSSLPRFVMSNNVKTNLQIAVSGNTVTIGYPIILGDY